MWPLTRFKQHKNIKQYDEFMRTQQYGTPKKKREFLIPDDE